MRLSSPGNMAMERPTCTDSIGADPTERSRPWTATFSPPRSGWSTVHTFWLIWVTALA